MTRKDEYRGDLSGTNSGARLDADNAAPPDEQVTEIRDSIEQTRAGMSETIDELQERLSPSHVKQQVREQVMEQYKQAKDSVREATIGKVEDMVERVSDTMYETRRSVMDTVTANPIPSALIGIGVAWLWMNRRSESTRAGSVGRGDAYPGARRQVRYRGGGPSMDHYEMYDESADYSADSARTLASRAGDAASGIAGQVQERATDLAGKAKETVTGMVDQGQQTASAVAQQARQTASAVAQQARQTTGALAQQARQTASTVVEQAQYRARRVEQRFNTALHENPLAVGAVALALGTAVGLAAPRTRKENEWMGEARDTLVDKAQAVAGEAMDKVQQVAQNVSDEMAPTADERSQG